MAMEERYDSALLGILQHEGEIVKFLDVIMGFLYRRTDYFRLLNKAENLGFPEGVAIRLLMKTFKKYDDMARKNDVERQRQTSTQKESKAPKVKNKDKPDQSHTLGVTGKQETTTTERNTSNTNQNPNGAANKKTDSSSDSSNKTFTQRTENQSSQPMQIDASTKQTSSEERKHDSDSDDDTEQARLQKQFQSNSDSYNGAVRDKYSWSQSITDLDVRVEVPSSVTKGKDVKVVMERKRLKVSHKSVSGEWETPLDGQLCWEINKEESVWTLDPGKHVHVNLEKIQERWWDGLLVGEEKINVRKIDASRPMTDLDDEAQAKIEEMMYNDRQKKLGLPQSHEQKVHDMLKQAWDVEGSPFKGQEFDPSQFNIAPNNMIS